MKKVLVILIFVIVSLCHCDNVFAQSDSIKVQYKKESIDSSYYSLKPKYKYLNVYLTEEKNLIKIGFKPLTILYKNSDDDSYFIAASFIFEKKLFTEWSIISEFEYSYGFYKTKSYLNSITKGHYTASLINIGVRHYYGMRKAIQQGNNGNNFNGNFFELSFKSIPPFNFSYYSSYNELEKYSSSHQIATKVQLAWGIQRKLSNFSFLDTKIHVGCKVYPVSELDFSELWYMGLDFTIGFGYNIKRR